MGQPRLAPIDQLQKKACAFTSYMSQNLFTNVKGFVDFAAEDIEAGSKKLKFRTEPTLPIYLKVIFC